LCDRAAILSQGELKGVFSLNELNKNTPCSFELEVENRPGAASVLDKIASPFNTSENAITFRLAERRQADLILRAVVDNKFYLKSFREIRGTLEDLFVKLVKFDEAKGN
jgi:ABC-type multidrug transport system ATPase subunit